MKYKFLDTHLEIDLSWKERFQFLFTGKIKFNKETAAVYADTLMNLATQSLRKYGNARLGIEKDEDKT